MSGHHPPLTCKQVKAALRLLGFVEKAKKSGTSHEDYVGTFRGQRRKVTVDCHEDPFDAFLVSSMAKQAGLKKKEMYAAVGGKIPDDWKSEDAEESPA